MAVYRQEERRGFQWRIAQTKLDPQGVKKKVVIKCRCSGTHVAVHDIDIDPRGPPRRPNCEAKLPGTRKYEQGSWGLDDLEIRLRP